MVTDDKPALEDYSFQMLSQIAFITVQVAFWSFVVTAWVKIYRQQEQQAGSRQLLSKGSLACASLTLLFTTVMTLYVRMGQQLPYDRWESRYLLSTFILSMLGLALGLLGKAAPRWVGFTTSLFTLLIALGDAASL